MHELLSILKRLEEIEELEGKERLDQLGSYIVGALIVDEKVSKLSETNPLLERIADLGSNLEASNAESDWASGAWQEIKDLIAEFKNEIAK